MTDADFAKLIRKHKNELTRIRNQRAELERMEAHLNKKIEGLEADRLRQQAGTNA